jgi:hypothetical protein
MAVRHGSLVPLLVVLVQLLAMAAAAGAPRSEGAATLRWRAGAKRPPPTPTAQPTLTNPPAPPTSPPSTTSKSPSLRPTPQPISEAPAAPDLAAWIPGAGVMGTDTDSAAFTAGVVSGSILLSLLVALVAARARRARATPLDGPDMALTGIGFGLVLWFALGLGIRAALVERWLVVNCFASSESCVLASQHRADVCERTAKLRIRHDKCTESGFVYQQSERHRDVAAIQSARCRRRELGIDMAERAARDGLVCAVWQARLSLSAGLVCRQLLQRLVFPLFIPGGGRSAGAQPAMVSSNLIE